MPITKYLARDLSIAVQMVGGVETDTVGASQTLTTPFGVATTDIITLTAHGLVAGDIIKFATLTGGAGLTTTPEYFVRTVTANTFQVASTANGDPINFTTDITAGTVTKITKAFVVIGGLNSLTHSPSTSRADTSSFDSAGREEHLPASRGDSWSLSGYALEDVVTKTRDVGQSRVEALGKLVGPSGLMKYRVTSPGGNTITFSASAEVTLSGGGHNDAAAWGAEVQVSGASVYA